MTDRPDPFGPVDPDAAADPDARANPFDPRRGDAIVPRRPDSDSAPLPGSVPPPSFSRHVDMGAPRHVDMGAPRERIPERTLTPGRLDPAAPRPQDRLTKPEPEPKRRSVRERLQGDDGQEVRDRFKKFGGPVGLAALAVWKVGRIALVALGKVGLLFKIPILGTVLSGLISIGAYAVFLGWPFAIGLVLSILIHELGHVAALKREGLQVKALNFIPFFGAYVLGEGDRSTDQGARIAIAGPLFGALFALAVYAVAGDSQLLLAIAFAGFYLNLLNLLPIPMLDGGHVGRLFPSAWWLGIAFFVGAAALGTGEGLPAMVAAGALIMAYVRRDLGWDLDPGDGIDIKHRWTAFTLYVAIALLCTAGMTATFRDRTDQLVDTYGQGAPAVVVSQSTAQR
ncbi:MAG: site-2 protease family protein [Solirubrobacteraceae bacterium]|nr:site-2 protease family protein [Solirubrobacteraceae bacterium]